jgi:hypothetical protein
MYSSTFTLNSELDEVVGQRHSSAGLSPEKSRYPLYMRRGGSQGRSGWVRITSPTPGFDPRTAHLTASRYTDYVVSTHVMNVGVRDYPRIYVVLYMK